MGIFTADYIYTGICASRRMTTTAYMSIDVGSLDIKTLYNLLLIAGPILVSVNAPLLLAVFY